MTLSVVTPEARARASKSRTFFASVSRSAPGFVCSIEPRSCGTMFSNGFAIATKGFRPLEVTAASIGSTCSHGAAGLGAAVRPPGLGIRTVRSRPSPAKGSSGIAPSPSHGPELQLEAGEFTGNEDRQDSGLLRLLPEITAAVQLEVE